MKREDKSCWVCGWNSLGGTTFIGVCFWFMKSKGMAREIPRDVADKGCKFWTAEKQDIAELRKSAPKIVEEEL